MKRRVSLSDAPHPSPADDDLRDRTGKPSTDSATGGFRDWPLNHKVIVVLLCLFALVGLAHLVSAAFAVPTVSVVPIERQPQIQTIVAAGRVYAPEAVAVRTLTRGTVDEVAFEEGDTVHAGQVLVRLHDEEVRAEVAREAARLAEAQARLARIISYSAPRAQQGLERAETDIEKATADVRRAEALLADSIISRTEFEEATQRFSAAREAHAAAALEVQATRRDGSETAVARAAVEVAHASLVEAKVRAGYTQATSPTDAVVLRREVARGDVVEAGTPLLALAPLGQTYLLIQPDERALALIKTGQQAVAVADGFLHQPFQAAVELIDPRSIPTGERSGSGSRCRPHPPSFGLT